MRTIFLLLVSFASFHFTLSAQNTGKITGNITTTNQSNIDYTRATISLLRAKDSGVIKLGVAGKTGEYAFENLKEGNYRVSITCVGFQKSYSAPVQISSAQPV